MYCKRCGRKMSKTISYSPNGTEVYKKCNFCNRESKHVKILSIFGVFGKIEIEQKGAKM